MANSVDPEQTAPFGSTLFAYAILSDTLVYEILRHLPYNAVKLGSQNANSSMISTHFTYLWIFFYS